MPSYGNTGGNSDGSRMNTGNSIWDPATGGRPSIRLHQDKSAMSQSVAPWLRSEDDPEGRRVTPPPARRPEPVRISEEPREAMGAMHSPAYDILRDDIYRLRGRVPHLTHHVRGYPGPPRESIDSEDSL